MLSSTSYLRNGLLKSTGTRHGSGRIGSNSARSVSRVGQHVSLRTRMINTLMGATVEGTRDFFSPERQARRLEQLKARMEAKRVVAFEEDESKPKAPEIGDLKAPLVRPKVNRRTGWTVGPIGFGTYRVTSQSMEHQAALEYALQTGAVNLIDTSPNYGVESESMVGMTLRNLMDANRIAREEIIVTTKIGPLRQGGALDAVKARAAKGRPFANMTLLTPEIGYCWDPEYIEFQLTKTLKTMQLDCIDLVMIDTPELLLPEKSNENVIGQLYRMLQGAMAHLEQEVKRGRIQYYGVSSSILRALHRVSDTPSLSLDMILRTANTLGSGDANKHHFAAVEYPMNLIEPHCAHNDVTTSAEGTAHIWSQMGRDSSVQLMAYEAGLLQFAVRPLNTLIETKDIFTHIPQPQHSLEPTGMLYRLTVPPMHDGAALAPRIKATINGCVGLEQSYALEYSKTVNKPAPPPKASTTPPLPPLPHPKEFCWAQIVIANLSRLDLETFKVSWKVQMKPGITASLATLRKACPDLEFWANNYEKGMNTLAEQYTQVLEINRASELEEFSSALIDCCPSLAENPSLSSKAVRVVGSTLASSTLVGMRTEKYVTDIVYGGGTPESPNSMLPIDPSLLGSIFDAGSRHMDFIRSNLKTQLASEEETAVNARREAAEERIMSEALAPRPPPPPRSSGSNPK